MSKITILIPVFQNQLSLNQLFNRIHKTILKNKAYKYEVIFVNDGSTDNSFIELLKLKNNFKFIKIISLEKNYGVNLAIKAGLKYCTGDLLTIIAADLQDPPELLTQMIALYDKKQSPIICLREDRDDPIVSKVFTKIYYFFIRFLINQNFPKGGFDLFLVEKKFFQIIENCPKSSHLSIELFNHFNTYQTILYSRAKREVGKSTWSFKKKLNLFFGTFLVSSVKFIKMVTLLGFMSAFISTLFGINIIYQYFFNNTIDVQGYSTIVTILCFMMSLLIIMLGLLTEYIINIYLKNSNHESFIIDKEILK